MALDASAAVGHEHENSSSPPRASSVGAQAAAVSSSAGSSPSASSSTSSLGDGVGLQTVPLQRSRSASPKCFGALGGKKKKAAPKGDVVSASPSTENRKGHRQRKNRRPPPAGDASVSGTSSPASSTAPSSVGDRLGFRTSHQPPCFVSKLPRGSNTSNARARSPGKQEETKGGGVGG
nr:uncharacterized protein LOC109733333 [Aegilops tauschii subsp. strangulata]